MSVSKLPVKSEPTQKEKIEGLEFQNETLRETIGDIWWLLTDLRDSYSAGIGPRSYVNAAIALAEPYADKELQ